MNSAIERRKSFDITSDDFTYCDILQHRRERLALFVDEGNCWVSALFGQRDGFDLSKLRRQSLLHVFRRLPFERPVSL